MEFNFKQNIILENEKVKLNPLHKSDLENLIYFSLEEPEIWKYSLVPPIGEEAMKQYIDQAIEGRNQEKEYAFTVYDKHMGKISGSTRFYDIQLKQKTLQLGYTWYGKEFQGTGINKNCKYLLLEFAFEQMGIERIEFRADIGNQRSIAAMKSIGCIEEGVLRKNFLRVNETRRDSIVLSILRDEWLGKVKDQLLRKL